MKQQCFEDICGCTVESCPITYSMNMIGGKWRPIIIMRISQNINRFGILQRGIDGISKNMLTRELRDLEKNNIISRKIYAEIPPRVEYSLTKKGKSLVPVLDKLNDWNMSNIQDVIDNTIHELNIDTPRFAKPIRVALTGTLSSPSIDLTIYLLGKEACLQRISSVKTLIT